MDLDQELDISTSAEAMEATALCRGHVVHTSDDAPQTPEAQPLPAALRRTPAEQKSEAQWAYERLVLFIKNFEEQLDQDQEIALGMTGGTSGALRIEGLGYFAPDILTFYGRNEQGVRTQLIQHVSQLNFSLVALPKEAPEEKPRRIGFRLFEDIEREDGGEVKASETVS
ncbi:DUF6173 family protein [Albirhodobacter sp. R86504]|uniref:DUF6173 family protein n=1 Tax=Albirhodobacter sp. R86504 TaxID=3093848 RepID=UPI00366AB3DA